MLMIELHLFQRIIFIMKYINSNIYLKIYFNYYAYDRITFISENYIYNEI